MTDMATAFKPELHTCCVCFDNLRRAHQETPLAQGARDGHGTDLTQLSQSLCQHSRARALVFALSFPNVSFLSQLVLRCRRQVSPF